ncbi:MAG: hypothetical protein HC903_04475 [Methylacidiphilales bacterium]|nr:hypothetical protein [Candidatus Methylacidiphilales bacterium]NJR14968.1 hypothetical protein [Calothrix sp. CSU_2_0]
MYKPKLLLVPVSLSLALSTLAVNFIPSTVLAKNVSFVASDFENLHRKQNKIGNFDSRNTQRWQDYDRKLQEQRDRQWQNNKRQWQDYNWRLQQRNTNEHRQWQNPQQQRSQLPDSDYNRQWQQQQQQWQNYNPQWDNNLQWQDYYRQ